MGIYFANKLREYLSYVKFVNSISNYSNPDLTIGDLNQFFEVPLIVISCLTKLTCEDQIIELSQARTRLKVLTKL